MNEKKICNLNLMIIKIWTREIYCKTNGKELFVGQNKQFSMLSEKSCKYVCFVKSMKWEVENKNEDIKFINGWNLSLRH